ncbi:MAG TPA: GAF domain-containing protein [Chloroflexi bacterium]|nr:GAF domain-containing protein [Chloroflexota bacterium]
MSQAQRGRRHPIGVIRRMLNRFPTLTVRFRLRLLFISMAIALVVAVGSGYRAFNRMHSDVTAINVAGSQRMRVFKLAFLAHRFYNSTNPDERVAAIADMGEEIARFDTYLVGLRNGDPDLGLRPATNAAVIDALERSAEAWQRYRETLMDYLAVQDPDKMFELLGRIDNQARPLVTQVDAVVQALEVQVQADAHHSQVLLGIALALGLLVMVGASLTIRMIGRDLTQLTMAAEQMAGGDLNVRAAIVHQDEIGIIGQTLNRIVARLKQTLEGLEQRVAERTRELERHSAYLETSAEVGRAATSILDMERLIHQVVEMIRDRFGLYAVDLFLVDPTGEWVEVQASASGPGQEVSAQERRLRVGEDSTVGWSIANAAMRVTPVERPGDVAEAVLPLHFRDQVLGALRVRSLQPDLFDQDFTTVLQTMADQIAIAISNARLFQQAQAALEAERRAYGEISREAWAQVLQARPDWGYLCTAHGLYPTDGPWSPEMVQARQTGQIVQNDGEVVAVPVKIRGQVVGAVRFRKPKQAGGWTTDELTLVKTLTEQLGVALESARLYQDSQRRALRERLTGEVTARIRETLDLEMMLKTAAQEVRQALGLPEVVIRLTGQPGNGAGTGDVASGATEEVEP